MTPIDGLERQLTTGLTDLAGTSTPDYRDNILRQVARTRQRPLWTFPERWLPMAVISQPRAGVPPSRSLALVLLIAALMVATLAAGAAILSSRLIAPRPDDGLLSVTAPIPHGGEAVLAYSFPGSNGLDGDIYTIRADGTDRRQITSGPDYDVDPIWSPDGSRIPRSGVRRRPVPASFGSRMPRASPHWLRTSAASLLSGKYRHGRQTAASSSIPSVGRTAGASGACSTTCGLSRRTEAPRARSSSRRRTRCSAPMRLGHRMAVESRFRVPILGLSGMPASGSLMSLIPNAPWGLEAHRITAPHSSDAAAGSWAPAYWSPDETRLSTIIQHFDTTGLTNSVVVPADGSSSPVFLWAGQNMSMPAWSPSGSRLSIMVQEGPDLFESTVYAAYLVVPDGGNRQQIDGPTLGAFWSVGLLFSPDGTRVIGHRRGVLGDLYVITLDGSSDPVTIKMGVNSRHSWQPVLAPLFGTPEPLASASPVTSVTP